MFPNWFNDVAALASVISLVISVYIAIQTRNLRKVFLTRARAPELALQLSQLISELPRHLGPKTNMEERVKLLSEIEGLLINLKGKLTGIEYNAINYCLGLMHPRKIWGRQINLRELDTTQLWKLYEELGRADAQLKHRIEDLKWG